MLLVLPLAALLLVFALERGARVRQAIELSRAYRGTTLLLSDVLEVDDEYTGFHSRSVVSLSVAVADEMGLRPKERRNVEFGALLHDVGKIAVPKEIINKPGPLTDDEWMVIKTHTIEGQRMLDRVGGLLSEVGRVVRSSHEKWDGTGYPDGLVGDQIPVGSAIVSCCDAFNAMTTDRSYRDAMPLEDAIEELEANSGTQFSPAVVEARAAGAPRGSAHRRCPGPTGSRGGLTAEAAGVRSKLEYMPKLPRTGGKASTSERAKKPAAKPAAAAARQGGHPHAEQAHHPRAPRRSPAPPRRRRSRRRTAERQRARQGQAEGARDATSGTAR